MTIDPVTLAILKGRLEQIADEMDATLFRSAFNPIIAEAHDASHGIYDAKTGDTLVQGKSGLPIFVGVMAFAVKAVIDKAAQSGGVHEGDVWIFNDPYDGGTHLSDFRLVKPVLPKRPRCSATWPRSAIGTMSAAMFRATTIRSRPNASRKAC
jgi:N-methylhydantoinase B